MASIEPLLDRVELGVGAQQHVEQFVGARRGKRIDRAHA